MGFNKSFSMATVTGNLAADPRINRVKKSGQEFAAFTVVVNEIYKGGHRDTSWIDCTAWGGFVELAKNYMKKGVRVQIGGTLKTKTWTDDDGNKRKNTYIQATTIVILDSKKDTEQKAKEPEPQEREPGDDTDEEEAPF